MFAGPDLVEPLSVSRTSTHSENLNRELLRVVGSLDLPSHALREASYETYFDHLYHRIPVLSRDDLREGSVSILIIQVLCLLHQNLRRSRDGSHSQNTQQLYTKVRTLLHTSYEKNILTRLKTICLLQAWNPCSPDVVELDGPWYWTGVGLRLAIQMGFHRESAYSRVNDPASARRIMWTLFFWDRLEAICFGRPFVLRRGEFTLRPPQLADFPLATIKTEVFIKLTELATLMGDMVECHTDQSQQRGVEIISALRTWIAELPAHLRPHNEEGQKVYQRWIWELHIAYFTCVIAFFHLCGPILSCSISPLLSLAAASCSAGLYEDIDCRDEANYLLSTHNWFLMLACVSQIRYSPNNNESIGAADLATMISVLQQMEIRFLGATRVLGAIRRLSQLQSETVNSRPENGQEPESAGHEIGSLQSFRQHFLFDAIDLFPYPGSLSPRIGLLQNLSDETTFHDWPTQTFATNAGVGWVFDEFAFDMTDPFINLPFNEGQVHHD